MRLIAAFAFSLTLASTANAKPSFDCETAASDVEKYICQDDGPITGGGSAWLDSQLARLYAIASDSIPVGKRAPFAADQRKFLRERDSCFHRRGCRIEDIYRARLKVVARTMNDNHAFQVFAGVGTLQIARYGKTVSLSVWTVGGNNHVCQFEQDDIPVGDDGIVRFDDEEMQFHMIVAPVGDTLQVTTEGGAGYCGARASMAGTYELEE